MFTTTSTSYLKISMMVNYTFKVVLDFQPPNKACTPNGDYSHDYDLQNADDQTIYTMYSPSESLYNTNTCWIWCAVKVTRAGWRWKWWRGCEAVSGLWSGAAWLWRPSCHSKPGAVTGSCPPVAASPHLHVHVHPEWGENNLDCTVHKYCTYWVWVIWYTCAVQYLYM